MTAATALASVADLRRFLVDHGPFTVAVWDFDGVVGDTEPTQAEAYRHMLVERGIAVEDDFFSDLAGRAEPEIWAKLGDRYGVEGEVARLRDERIALVMPMLTRGVDPNWFVRPGVATLHEAGTRSVVISSGNKEVIDRCLDVWQLSQLFDGVSAMSGQPDDVPKRERLRNALAGVDRSLVIEDSAEYLQLASELGAVTLGVQHALNGTAAQIADAVLQAGTECVD